MKFTSFLLLFCLSFNVLAQSQAVQSLEQGLDDYQYAVTVEWDQKDSAFHDQQTEKFFNKMSSLVKDEGLQKEEILALAEKKMSNKVALEALKLKLNVLTSAQSTKELAEVLRTNSKEFYTAGASWNGATVENAIIVGVVAVFAYAIWYYATHDCVEYKQSESLTCRPVHMGYDSNFDPIYGPVECSYGEMCIKYEKKN